MANLNLLVTIGPSGKTQISTALPQPTGGPGNLTSNIAGNGNIYAQQMIFQNQGAANMWIGDATTTDVNGLLLGPSGSANFGAFINYGTYLSDWWVVGTPGQVLFVLYIQ
jgi:hypothetical protein